MTIRDKEIKQRNEGEIVDVSVAMSAIEPLDPLELSSFEEIPLIEVDYTEEQLVLDYVDLYHPRSPYTPEQKVSAVMAYLVTGNSKRASKHCGIKDNIIRDWKTRSDWWPEAMRECRKKKQEELDSLYTSLLHQTVGQLADRIQNGDEYLKKDGTKARKLLTARDLAIITGIIYDKRALLRGDPTGRIEKRNTGDSLIRLQKNFDKIAKQLEAKTIKGSHTTIIEEAEYVEE
jgi:hypothetical protein